MHDGSSVHNHILAMSVTDSYALLNPIASDFFGLKQIELL